MISIFLYNSLNIYLWIQDEFYSLIGGVCYSKILLRNIGEKLFSLEHNVHELLNRDWFFIYCTVLSWWILLRSCIFHQEAHIRRAYTQISTCHNFPLDTGLRQLTWRHKTMMGEQPCMWPPLKDMRKLLSTFLPSVKFSHYPRLGSVTVLLYLYCTMVWFKRNIIVSKFSVFVRACTQRKRDMGYWWWWPHYAKYISTESGIVYLLSEIIIKSIPFKSISVSISLRIAGEEHH